MIDDLLAHSQPEPRARWASLPSEDQEADVRLVEHAALAGLETALADWEGVPELLRRREAFDLDHARETVRVLRLAGHGAAPVRELPVPHGLQCVGPPYDRAWGTGSGWPLGLKDGSMFVLGSDGFSASGIGMHLHAEDDGFVSVFPKGYAECTWVNLGDAIGLHSRAGAGAVVYDGSDLLVSRQPVIWDLHSPIRFTGDSVQPWFGDIRTPPAPGTFGSVPIAPVLFPVRKGRNYLLWFYMWHVGAGMRDAGGERRPFLAFITADLPLLCFMAGDGPVVR